METFSIVGRKREQTLLQKISEQESPDFLAVYGRRRVGKTYLIRNFFNRKACIYFEVTGLKKGSLKKQLGLFIQKLKSVFLIELPARLPKNWLEAFQLLTECINKVSSKESVILFFDELPWFATKKSGFIQALDHFWNSYWSTRKKLKLIVCGSAASWMLENLIKAKGGLHNRLTAVIALRPFSLYETEEYLRNRGIQFGRRQVLELYMAIGGIPHYLNHVQKNLSPAQNINQMCFNKSGPLFDEFGNLFASLFDESPAHVELIRLIARSRYGVNMEELVEKSKLSSSGGTLKMRLNELEEAGFISSFVPYMRRKKGIFYRIIDEYTLFYLHWIEPVANRLKLSFQSSNYWESKMQTQAWKIWSGYAFEAICLKHIAQIKETLGIHGVASEVGSWRYIARNKKEMGTQIDLLIDRADGITNLCEIKYHQGGFPITKAIAENLERKIQTYKTVMDIRKTILLTMITPDGMHENEYATRLVSEGVTLDDLYRPE